MSWSPRVDPQDCSPSQSGNIQFSVGQTIILCGALFDYGATPDGSPVNVVFTITNIGGSALLLGPAVIIGDQSFAIPANIPPVWIVPGASRDVTVQFNPTVEGPHSSTLTCNANGLVSGCTIDLAGEGTACVDPTAWTVSSPSSPPHFNGSAWDFGSASTGTPLDGTIRFTNSGSVTITGISVSLTGDSAFTIVGTPFSGDLNPGDHFDLPIQLLSSDNNAYTGEFVVGYNENCGIPRTGDLVGSVIPPCVSPVISVQPVSWVASDSGSPAIFSAVATGTGPMIYQWQVSSDQYGAPLGNWTDLAEGGWYTGVFTTSLAIDLWFGPPFITYWQWYRIVATNGCGSATSDGLADLQS